jgi:Immunoglobulin-like domain of bacterial spore germination/Sporulation and spore germination
MRRLTAGLAVLGMLWALSGCAGAKGSAAGGSAPPATGPARHRTAPVKQRDIHLSGRQLNLAVYYLRTFNGRRYLAPEWHPVPYTRAAAGAAVGELVGGEPYCPGSQRPFPAGARLRGVQVEDGTATVDLSGVGPRPSQWTLQALVHTLTQFPTVRKVLVRVDGRALGGPLVRDPALPLAPIALAAPVPGAQVSGGRLVVRGEASVDEGTVGLRLRDDRGQVMAQGHTTAAVGAPGRGPFAGALRFTPPAAPHPWTLEAFEVSAEDGEIVYLVQLPVWVGR